jgi:glycosyltransferase involved in cell wall biosynthesis
VPLSSRIESRVLTAWDLQAITGPRPTGLGYAVKLLRDAYTQHGGPDGEPAKVLGLRPNDRDEPLRSVLDRVLWEQWRLPRALVGAEQRSVQSQDVEASGRSIAPPLLLYSPALGAPLRCGIPVVAHVHDLIPLADPSQFTSVARWYWTKLLPATWKRCRAITVSNSSLVDEVEQRLRYPRERIHVVPYYAGIDPDERIEWVRILPQGLPALTPLFLALATHEPRKNIGLAVRAVGELKRRGIDVQLVCAGGHTRHTVELVTLAGQLSLAKHIEWQDYVPRRELLAMMWGATALLFPSKLEGYGMPPQEAQFLGTPVVLSDIPCHRAVYDDPQRWTAVLPGLREPPPFVGTDDVTGLADAMQRLLEDAAWRERLSAAGRAYQATFSPEATAQALRHAFESALAT